MITDLTEVEALLKEHEERIKKLEKRVPMFDIPKQKRRRKSERERIIERQLKNSFK